MSGFDLRSLLQVLDDHRVSFIVIGGVAVVAHGHLRTTADLDLVPDPAAENLSLIVEVLAELDATLPAAGGRSFDPERDGASLQQGKNVTADTSLGGLDVVQLARGVPGFSVLEADAVESEVLGTRVRICSLARLREMKEAQGRAQDMADLENLPAA